MRSSPNQLLSSDALWLSSLSFSFIPKADLDIVGGNEVSMMIIL